MEPRPGMKNESSTPIAPFFGAIMGTAGWM
jgi:hypothetical protein